MFITTDQEDPGSPNEQYIYLATQTPQQTSLPYTNLSRVPSENIPTFFCPAPIVRTTNYFRQCLVNVSPRVKLSPNGETSVSHLVILHQGRDKIYNYHRIQKS
jgi:hypothetical protein